ncbi:RNA polymerase sigma factor [bacterium]|nr:RNA polymerase sigma factor [bacterium]
MDKGDIKTLYEKYAGALHAQAFKILRNKALADEALQDAFINVVRYGDSFKGESSPYTWLYRIVTNCALSIIKKNKPMDEWDEKDSRETVPVSRFEKKDVSQFLDKLKDDEKQIFIYRYFDDLKMDEITALTQLSRKTIFNKLERVEEKIKRFFGEHHE